MANPRASHQHSLFSDASLPRQEKLFQVFLKNPSVEGVCFSPWYHVVERARLKASAQNWIAKETEGSETQEMGSQWDNTEKLAQTQRDLCNKITTNPRSHSMSAVGSC